MLILRRKSCRTYSFRLSIGTVLVLTSWLACSTAYGCDNHDETSAGTTDMELTDNVNGTLPPSLRPKDVLPGSKGFTSSYEISTSTTDIVNINNAGVRALNDGDFKTAINRFEKSLSLDSNYKIGRLNLGIAYNNYALSLKDKPSEALLYFEKAAYVDPGNKITASNVGNVVRMLSMDPNSFAVRERLGNAALDAGNLEGAFVQYHAAFAIKPDPGIQRRIAEVQARIFQRSDPNYKEEPYWSKLLSGDYETFVGIAMCALYLLDLFIVVELMRRMSSHKRSWWIFGLTIAAISVSAGFLMGQANLFTKVLGMLVLGLPPARALYAISQRNKVPQAYSLYLMVVFMAALPCAYFLFGWLGCICLRP